MSEKHSATPHAGGPLSIQEGSTSDAPTLAERAAYHEAGHFVASMHLRRRVVGRVSIVPDHDQGIQGVVNHGGFDSLFKRLEYADPEDRKLRYDVEREIVLCLAGEAAEIVFFDRADPVGFAGDKESAMAMATRIFPRPEEAAAFIAWLGYRAEYVVGLPYNRLRVEALARVLIERKEMHARQAREIVESVDPDAIELVRGLGEGARKIRQKKPRGNG